MTATTTIPGSHPTHRNRPLWVALGLALAAVIAITAAVVALDDDGSSAGRATGSHETTVAHPSAVSVSADAAEARALPKIGTTSAVPVSADAAEARALPDHVVVHRPAGYEAGSADAAERAALAERERDRRACAYSAAPPEAFEACLNGG